MFKTNGGERVKVNFLIFYEIAQQTVKGFKIADEPPSAEQLAFSKEIARRRRCQVMRWLAYQFSTIGRWWAGA